MYSAGLIEGSAAVGAEIDVVCMAGSRSEADDAVAMQGVRWHLVPGAENARWKSVFSTLPHIAQRCATLPMRRTVLELAHAGRWDVVVIDGLSMGWALPLVSGIRRRRGAEWSTVVAHVSHNHEETTRAAVARALPGASPYKFFAAADARKAARLERKVAAGVDLLTAITPEDRELFDRCRASQPTIVLTPGYSGRHVPARKITHEVPRGALILGSFDWIAKQVNLVQFLEIAAPRFASAGIEIRVVGGGAPNFLASVRRRFPTVTFTGHVPDVAAELKSTRIAIVPERFGGGFKLKLLDLVFNRVPIAALQSAMHGIPLRNGESTLTYPDQEHLVGGVLAAIDNISLLNRLQDGAYRSCETKFDWTSRGSALLSAATAL